MLVQSLSWEDPLEKEMASHSSIHAWRIPWTEEPDGLWSMRSQRVGLKRRSTQGGGGACFPCRTPTGRCWNRRRALGF